jgi:hypothetical protein
MQALLQVLVGPGVNNKAIVFVVASSTPLILESGIPTPKNKKEYAPAVGHCIN